MDNNYIATCKFGLEGIVADELRALGIEDVRAENARVYFSGGWNELCRANIWLRAADRVFLEIGRFPAKSFEELFEGVKALPWEDYLPKDCRFPVKGKSAKSILHSVSDCQAITKKAVVERLKKSHELKWFPETGDEYIIEVGMLDDIATIALDASGVGLNRRGYRLMNVAAPLSETLAASLVLISRYRGDRVFWDPMCGSGTIAIEAAMIAANRAPGMNREFSAENWSFIPKGIWRTEKSNARDLFKSDAKFEIIGSDIDADSIELSQEHAKNAGVNIKFLRQDMRQMQSSCEKGLMICNPPYGERMMEQKEVEKLYIDMGKTFFNLPNWKGGILTSHPKFERCFGKKADKRRKLYNSSIICQYYQYFYKK